MSIRDRPGIARPRTATSGARTIRAALSMLTRIPVAAAGDVDDTGAAAYALVGALVGAIAAIPIVLLAGVAPTLAAILAVGALAITSGGLHLDGLADTADALIAPDRMRAEAARKDPGVGSGGVVALVLVLAAQVAGLVSVMTIGGTAIAVAACIAAGAASRTLPVVVAWAGRGHGPAAGLGAWFLARVGPTDVAAAVLTTAAVTGIAAALAGSVVVPLGVALGTLVGLAVAFGLVRARGQIDGDLLGATVEVGFAAIVGAMAVALNVAWPGL
jgi:adenosylcobinamide-GDP ribazoletransferase